MSRPTTSGRPRHASVRPSSPATKTPAAKRSRTGSSADVPPVDRIAPRADDGELGAPAQPQEGAGRGLEGHAWRRESEGEPGQRSDERLADVEPSGQLAAHDGPAPVALPDDAQRLADLHRVEHVGRKDDPITGAADLPAEHEVLGQIVAERADAADRVEGLARHQDRLSDDARPSEHVRDEGRARHQAAVQVERLDPRAQALGSGGAKKVRHEADAWDHGTTRPPASGSPDARGRCRRKKERGDVSRSAWRRPAG